MLCLGHFGGFKHLAEPVPGFETEYDLGFEFEQRESDEFVVEPATCIKAWAEPILELRISVRRRDGYSKTLRYGKSRSSFIGGMEANAADKSELLKRAALQLASDLESLRAGKEPAPLKNVAMI